MKPNITSACIQILKQHAKTFRLASYLLPPQMRDDAAIAYAFCRLVDDTVDDADSEARAAVELGAIEDMVLGLVPSTPLVSAYLDMCRRRNIELTPTLHLIGGARSDLSLVRVEDDAQLFRYCYQVAGTVGLIMCGIMGVTDRTALQRAVDLGIAMQLTNICRDVLEDAKMDRVYLPQQRLLSNGSDQATLIAHVRNPSDALTRSVASTVSELLIKADHHYQSATLGMRFLSGRVRLSIMVASSLYRQIGVRLLRLHRGNALLGRVVVPKWQKLTLTFAAIVRYLRGRSDYTIIAG